MRINYCWLFLACAIVLEVSAVSLLKVIPNFLESYSEGNNVLIGGISMSTNTIANINLIFMISLSYYFMSLALRGIGLAVAYSVWEIVGLSGILLISFIFFNPDLNLRQYIGVTLGAIGVICVILGEEH